MSDPGARSRSLELDSFGYVALVPPGPLTRVTLLVLCALTALAPSPVFAEGAESPHAPIIAPTLPNDGGSEPLRGGGENSARGEFEQALALYRAGQYPAALEHLQNASKLDPAGKDLFFNLALVHEKLGQFDEAIAALERFRELEPDPAERERARLTIERLRGAAKATAAPAPCPAPAPPSPDIRSRGSSPWASPLLVGTASLAAVSLVVGVVFGAKALSDDVDGVPTSPELSLGQLRERGRRAQREALVADIAFALSVASAGTFAGVWLMTPSGQGGQGQGAGITLRSYF